VNQSFLNHLDGVDGKADRKLRTLSVFRPLRHAHITPARGDGTHVRLAEQM
jgi:hypothetical protein